jgi:dynein heavy chain
MATTVEKDIAAPVKVEADKAKDNVAKFEERLKEYFINMKKESFYQYKSGVEEANERLD